ncbi:DNA-binding LytR/AlgR family response regulator [Lewinella marina]|uniref:HTH LytTR-type domain-containing protein n=1 Tax=Neolewinella marina TaxID=438751 RepID=A0A2G0CK37_9BACT|nr:LytTR family transcriptional regulator DNA-binding domain-containing protein [Neolewinella marina]NJB84471.1 DNA-binding LytR/AlgR family response regulator [Neolewinella marina]PHL00337.1 hypothetical protein CGL56_04705 [Neolewinella marina]
MHIPATALVLEGEKFVADKVTEQLEHLGYDVVANTSRGEEAVARCQQQPPDLLVAGDHLTGLIEAGVALQMIQDAAPVPTVALAAVDKAAGTVMPRGSSAAELAACIARAFGVPSWDAATGPPQDYILNERILLRHNERMVSLAIADIRFVQDYRNYSSVSVPGETYLIAISLPLVEHRLAGSGFLRVHRDLLVNLRHVTEARYDELTLDRGITIPVGRPYRRRVNREVKVGV